MAGVAFETANPPEFNPEALNRETPPVLDVRLEIHDGLVASGVPLEAWEALISGLAAHNTDMPMEVVLSGGQPLQNRLAAPLIEYCASIPGVSVAVEQGRDPYGNTAYDPSPSTEHVITTPATPVTTAYHWRIDPQGIAYQRLTGQAGTQHTIVFGDSIYDLKGALEHYTRYCARSLILDAVAAQLPDSQRTGRRALLAAAMDATYDARSTPDDWYAYDAPLPSGEPDRRPAGPQNLHIDLAGLALDTLNQPELGTVLYDLRNAGLNTVRLRMSGSTAAARAAVLDACDQLNLRTQLVADTAEPIGPSLLAHDLHDIVIPVASSYRSIAKLLQPNAINILDKDTAIRLQAIAAQLQERPDANLILQLPVYARDIHMISQLPVLLRSLALTPDRVDVELIEPEPLKLTMAECAGREGFYAVPLIELGAALTSDGCRTVTIRHWVDAPGHQAVLDSSYGLWGGERMLSAPLVPVYYGNLLTDGFPAVLEQRTRHLQRFQNRRQRITAVRLPLGEKVGHLAANQTPDLAAVIGKLAAADALAAAYFGIQPRRGKGG